MRNAEWVWRELRELHKESRERAEEHLLTMKEQRNRYATLDYEELDIMESELY